MEAAKYLCDIITSTAKNCLEFLEVVQISIYM